MVTAKDAVGLAKCFNGLKEYPAGSNNIIFNTRYYGREVSGSNYAWCAVFIWDLFQMLDAPELYYGGKKTASCTTLWHYMRDHGQQLNAEDPLRPGDLVFYKFNYTDGKAHHIGMITETDGKNLIAVIEGNTSKTNDDNGGSVMNRYDRKMSQVIAVCRPDYTEEEEKKIMDQKEWNDHMHRFLDERDTYPPAPWSEQARIWAETAGVIRGDEMGDMHYKAWCTREEMIQMLYNMKALGL